jgi:hypothetical protein
MIKLSIVGFHAVTRQTIAKLNDDYAVERVLH